MREQSVTAKVYYTVVKYELPDNTQKTTSFMGKYNSNRARSLIEREEGSQVFIMSLEHHCDKARMSANEFLKHAEIIEQN